MHTRLLAPDLARGFMLLFIALANVSVYLWGANTNAESLHPVDENSLSTALAALVIVFIDGSVYPMFAFLFGYGMTQFAYKQVNSGVPAPFVTRMLLKRNLLLLIFGALHAALLFAGDILGAYGLTGLALSVLVMRGSDKTLRILLWTLGSVVTGMLLLLAFSLITMQYLLPPEVTAMVFNTGEIDIPTTAYLMTGIENFFLAMAARLGLWLVSSAGAVLTLLVPFAVLLGVFAARYRWLENMQTKISLKSFAFIGIGIGVLSGLPLALSHLQIVQFGELNLLALSTFAQLFGVINGVAYAALFALLAGKPGKLQVLIAGVGKRSLSFYLLQSLIFAPILSAWGFGLGGFIDTATAYFIAVLVWLLSVLLAYMLDKSGKMGPAEWLLRRLAYGKVI